jgi:hypothetical protein
MKDAQLLLERRECRDRLLMGIRPDTLPYRLGRQRQAITLPPVCHEEPRKMADVQVTCIVKPGNDDRHESITDLGGATWKWPVRDVIASIEAKTNTFYTSVRGKRADVGVVNGSNGKYARTYADGQWNNNLLELDRCS